MSQTNVVRSDGVRLVCPYCNPVAEGDFTVRLCESHFKINFPYQYEFNKAKAERRPFKVENVYIQPQYLKIA